MNAASGGVDVQASGKVTAGAQPAGGSSVQLYAVGQADGSASTPLLRVPAVTDGAGQFTLDGYTCPSASTQVYLTAMGGGPGSATQDKGSTFAAMLALGNCGDLKTNTHINVNESSTVAAVYSLVPFMTAYDAVSADPTKAQLVAQAFATAASLVDSQTNSASGAVRNAAADPTESGNKLNALANILASCTTAMGGKAGDGSTCGTLFSLATQDTSVPTQIISIIQNIAKNPSSNVNALFVLAPGTGPFQPSLTSTPADWALAFSPAPKSPDFSPQPGTFSTAPSVTLSNVANAKTFYTVDGSVPTASSRMYSGPIALSASTLVRAFSVVAGVSSLPVSGAYTLARPSVLVAPATAALQPSQSQSFVASVSDAQNKAVSWSIVPAVGSVSSTGAYTAPAIISQAQTINVIATSVADPTVSSVSKINLVPPVQVGITPASVTLQPAQTQSFVASVTGTSNASVIWSLSPALGSVSQGGSYTAPSLVLTPRTVTVTATSVANPAVSATSTIALIPSTAGATWYMSPSGSDSRGTGTRANPWLTPNHSGLTCGDSIIAASGLYPSFTVDTTPTCATHNAVFVQCEVFAACKVNGSQTQGGILITASYWAVLGWEVTTPHGSSDLASCFQATPGRLGPIHDIYFINDIANGCQAGGFTASNAVDYYAAVADIAYNAAQGNTYCYSGFSVYQPYASDTAAGTHIYLSQLFTWNNVDPAYCQGGNSTDGEGVILDTFNGLQGSRPPYAQQAVVENVLALYNGAGGIYEGGSGNSNAKIYMRHNTAYGNFTNHNQSPEICGQIESAGYPTTDRRYINVNTELSGNLAVVPNGARLSGCGNNPAYAYFFGNVDASTVFNANAGFSSVSNNVGVNGAMTGFSAGSSNLYNQNPSFPNATQPSAPTCGGTTNVIACMSSVVSGFTPGNAALKAFGYQAPSAVIAYDPLFPKWLCNSKVPAGLVTMGCSQ